MVDSCLVVLIWGIFSFGCYYYGGVVGFARVVFLFFLIRNFCVKSGLGVFEVMRWRRFEFFTGEVEFVRRCFGRWEGRLFEYLVFRLFTGSG